MHIGQPKTLPERRKLEQYGLPLATDTGEDGGDVWVVGDAEGNEMVMKLHRSVTVSLTLH